MTDFRGNIDHWIRHSEPDYYIFFIKAWIPFNAWYVAELPNFEKKDSKIIQELQDNINSKPRNIIEQLLQNNDYTSLRFRSHLAELHNLLEKKGVKHNGKKLSFTNINLSENPETFSKAVDKKGNIYKAEKKNDHFEALILDKNKRKISHIKQNPYDLKEFKKNYEFIKIKESSIREKILQCYEEIDPKRSISLVSNSRKKSEKIHLISENEIYFIKDPTTIAKACIKILYALRCMLFHGELEPNLSNISIYEHSYHILRIIIKDLK